MKHRMIRREYYTGIRRYSFKGLPTSNVCFRKILTSEHQPGTNARNDSCTGTERNTDSIKFVRKPNSPLNYYRHTKMRLKELASVLWRVCRETMVNRDRNVANRGPLQAGIGPKMAKLETKETLREKEPEENKITKPSTVYPDDSVELKLQEKLKDTRHVRQDVAKQVPESTSSARAVAMVDDVRIYAMQIPQLLTGIVSTLGWSWFHTETKNKPPQQLVKTEANVETETVAIPIPQPVPVPKPEKTSTKEIKLDKPPPWKRTQAPWTSGPIAASRTRYLMRAVASASTPVSQASRLQDFCQHLIDNPQAKSLAVKERAISMMLRIRAVAQDNTVKGYVNEALSLLGYIGPLNGKGIRILSIDGGGTRGVMALEILRTFEQMTNQPVHRLFDFMCGVSTGAILSVLLGAMKASMDECEELYKRTSCQIFNQNTWLGTGKLVFNHAFYDTNAWVNVLRKNIGEIPLYQTARDADCPKIATVSTIVNEPRLRAFLFRNYDYPYRNQSNFPGSYSPQLWEAVRASAAAPGYFEEYKLGEHVHQDGGILTNNPSALAIHECRHLWPGEEIQCVISIGNGRYEPQLPVTSNITASSLKTKLLKIVDSATDTEGVHMILNDLLPPKRYYRFNPYLSDAFSLDEVRPEKFKTLQNDARMYIRKNEHKIREAAVQLLEPKTSFQRIRDSIKEKILTYL